jgi:hypothetical protein
VTLLVGLLFGHAPLLPNSRARTSLPIVTA